MNITVKFLVCISLLLPNVASSASIVAIRAGDSPFINKYFSGFSASATDPVSAFQYDSKREKALFSKVKKLAPDLLFTIGAVPIKALADALPSTPIVVGANSSLDVKKRTNVVVLHDDYVAPRVLSLAQSLFPKRKTIGTIFNPSYSQSSFDAFVKEAAKLKVRVASLKVESPEDVEGFINAFSGKVDLIYWIRDTTTADPKALDALYNFANQNAVPVVSMDPGHLKRGAVMSIAIDAFQLGERAWEITKKIIEEGKFPKGPVRLEADQLLASFSLRAVDTFDIEDALLHTFLQTTVDRGYGIKIEK